MPMKPRKTNSESGFTLIEVIITIVIIAVVAAMMTAYFGTGITQSSLPIFRLSAAGKLNAILEKITADYDAIPRWIPGKSYAVNDTVIPTPSKKTYYQYRCATAGQSGLLSTNEPMWPVPGTILPVSGYVCITPPDTSCTVVDNGVTWYLYYDNNTTSALVALQTKIAGGAAAGAAGYIGEGSQYKDRSFGGDNTVKYKVIHNRFIRFGADNKEVENETTGTDNCKRGSCASASGDDYGKYLKVTIGLHSEDADADKAGTLTTLFVKR
jgi:prepilin-type N-terminal cleavage/methylation domain-containing protein